MSNLNENQTSIVVEISDKVLPSVETICRLCANSSTRAIGIYSEEGISNDLAGKMNLYLPIKVSDTDSLPLHCCWRCASTVLAWHELVVASVEADRRFKNEFILSSVEDACDLKEFEVAERSLDMNYEVENTEIATVIEDNE